MAKRGKYRTVDFYRDPKTNREIHGLKRRPDGRFYAAVHPTKTFGKDPRKAIKKFRQWETQRTNKTIPVLTPLKPMLDESERVKTWIDALPADSISLDHSHAIIGADEVLFWETVSRLIAESPKLVAEKTGIEEIGYLENLKPPRPAIRIKDVVTYYADKQQTSQKERRHGQSTWSEFVKVIREVNHVQRISDISQDHINHYNTFIHGRISKGEIESKTAKSKIQKVKTILNHAIKKCPEDDKPQLRRVRDLCDSIDSPNGNGNGDGEKIITPRDFHKLLKTAKTVTLAGSNIDPELWNCLLLVSLNCCMTGSDLASIKPEHIDLRKKTLVMKRPKNEWRGTNSPIRVAVLWDRTVAAIRRYKRKCPHGLPWLFGNCDYRKGARFSKLSTRSITRQFGKLAAKAKVDAMHKMLRSSGYTAAIDGGADALHAEILMGHRVKITNVTDAYLVRNPTMVADASAAIEKVYFSQKKG